MRKRLISKLIRGSGNRLLEEAMGRYMPDADGKATLGSRLTSFVLLRVAMGSVPGAIVVGGGLIAKALHDQNKARKTMATEAATIALSPPTAVRRKRAAKATKAGA